MHLCFSPVLTSVIIRKIWKKIISLDYNLRFFFHKNCQKVYIVLKTWLSVKNQQVRVFGIVIYLSLTILKINKRKLSKTKQLVFKKKHLSKCWWFFAYRKVFESWQLLKNRKIYKLKILSNTITTLYIYIFYEYSRLVLTKFFIYFLSFLINFKRQHCSNQIKSFGVKNQFQYTK